MSVGVWDFAAYRFLTGLGVGGEFGVGVALVAEVMPSGGFSPNPGEVDTIFEVPLPLLMREETFGTFRIKRKDVERYNALILSYSDKPPSGSCALQSL